MKAFAVFLLCLVLACGSALAENALMPDIFPDAISDGYFSFGGQPEGGEPIAEEPAVEEEEKVWAYPVSLETLEDALDIIRLVDRDHLLDKSYPPDDELHALVNAVVRKTSSTPIQAREIANEALEQMFAAADADGVKLYLHSGYRSYGTQATMYDNRLRSVGKDDGVVQMPGASDHQTGLGFDIVSWSWRDSKLNEKFAETEEAQWMAANCAQYGFIIRYPRGKESVTGIMYEPWHLRYVGVEAALYMTDRGLTLEEFTIEWKSAYVEFVSQSGQPETEDGKQDSFSF